MIGGALGRILTAGSYLAGHLSRRDRSVWVFGNQKGFRDNPRYLAEHLVHEHPHIETWWIARSEGEASRATAAGLHATRRGSREAIRVQRRAGAAFLSNGFQDLEPAHLGGAFVVDLRHGKGLKRVLLDMPSDDRGGMWGAATGAIRRWWTSRRLAQVSLIVAPGEMAREMYISAYRCPPSRVRVLGSPRFDVIRGGPAYERAAGGDLRQRLGVGPDDYVVLWLPTWREAGDGAWLPRLELDLLTRSVEGTSIVMLVKPHPYSDAAVFAERLPDHPRLRLLPEAEVDANCLLRVADALITDFSSAAFDYALLDRPIHFLVPDIADYRDGRGLYEPFENISAGNHHTGWSTLLAAVRRSACGEDASDRDHARRILARGQINAAPGSSERIAAAVAQAIGLEDVHAHG
jgi:CDP-glycerol glycerophosphotransferase (TagB/SpsB family)